MSEADVLYVEDLAYRYGKTEVFAGASLSLRAGEVAFLTGPNGAGKSTLLRCLAGWDAPAEGRVELCGRRFDGADRAQRSLLAFVPDVPSFYDDLTAGEHIRFVRQANRMSADDDPSERLMALFGLDGHRDQLPSAYSRGMRQKLALVLLRVGIAGARTTPLKLSHPDIAYLAASAVSARALAGVPAGVQAFAGAAAGAALGFLLGVGLESASVLAGAPAAVALAGAALAAAAVALGWVVGFVRLASDGWSGWRTAAAAFVLVAFAVSWCGVALAAGADALLAPATFAVLSVGGFFVLAVAAIALALLAPRVDMTRVIDENSLHADLCQFGMLSPLDRNDIAEYQRRRKLADRPVRFSLPRGEGRLALVQRAALSHARQYDGLASLVMQGAFVVPLGVLALLGAGGPVLFVFWLPVAVLMPQGVREATRAFRDDARNRLVRDRLPFGVLELLAFDTLPAFAATTLLACGAVAAMIPIGTSLPLALALAVLVGAASLLCCGLDAVRLFPGGPRLCYEYGALALVGVGFALSLFASAAVAAMGMALFAAAVALVVRFGSECVR